MRISSELLALLPEISLIVGALISMAASMCKNAHRYIYAIPVISLLISLHFMIQPLSAESCVFTNSIEINNFTFTFKSLLVIASLALLFSISDRYFSVKVTPELPGLLLFSLTGGMVMIGSNGLLPLYLGMELMTLPFYIMVASNLDDRKSQEASVKYFILGSISSCFFLFGCAIIYGSCGSIDFSQIRNFALTDGQGNHIFALACIFVISAFCFKISLAPFHIWVPDVYQGSSTYVTGLLSSLPKIASLAIFAKLMYRPFYGLITDLSYVYITMSVLSLFTGAFAAFKQKNIKRLLAYASISQVGFMVSALATGKSSDIQYFTFYMAAYMAANIGFFTFLIAFEKSSNNLEISQLSGLASKNPVLSVLITIFVISMAGIPPFIGFFGKFYVIIALINGNLFPLACCLVLASLISVYYYLKIIKAIYFDKGRNVIKINISCEKWLIMFLCAAFCTFSAIQLDSLLIFTKNSAGLL
ncbi:NADH-quinone oxidoreductase subunit N [Candidatus Cyrtobacter comes]|uniref:NADH-quinone oxidoreductase subunit N n=1 Tax=Candidatus Cyrtobacter comes TaxID=675776 RepID=A0ABU5L747_9RICK|nr:NADH-quinone oxidoreductase subunit N [Candidatus Cyrtobacter comes]MDZ5761872.1 NADH-quinone oxidoreductase subunit N [Candidatus Cyrtobacter comes]